MKRKYFGILSASIFFLALSITILYIIDGSWKKGQGVRFSPIKPLFDFTVPGPSAIKEIKRLENRMPDFVYPPKSDYADVNLLLFGFQPVERPMTLARGSAGERSIPGDYSLTFAFTSDKKRFCIIDGSFYSEGSTLPGAGKIVKIESKRVLVKKHKLSRWIPMRDWGIEELRN